jgi:hypothetical protein
LFKRGVHEERDQGAKLSRESQLLSFALFLAVVSEVLRTACAVKEMLDQLHLSAQVVQRNLVERLGLRGAGVNILALCGDASSSVEEIG